MHQHVSAYLRLSALGLVVDQTEAFFWNGEVWLWSECRVIPARRWAEPVVVYSEMAARESLCSSCVTETAGSQLPLDIQTRSRNSSGILLARRFNLLKINKNPLQKYHQTQTGDLFHELFDMLEIIFCVLTWKWISCNSSSGWSVWYTWRQPLVGEQLCGVCVLQSCSKARSVWSLLF